MALTVLVEARPLRAADATPVVVRLAGLGSRPYTHANVNDWWAGITDAPRFASALDFGQQGWTGGAIPTTGAINFEPSDRSRIDALSTLVWNDADVTIWTGDDAQIVPVWTVELTGKVAGVAVRGGTMTITVADLSAKLARPIAPDRFGGNGGIDGGTEVRERLKRRSFGRCWGVEARLLDKSANIYEVGDPGRPLLAIDAVKERGRSASAITVVAWAGSIAATLAALKAVAVPEGGAAVAPSIACLKWWTQQPGLLTVDLRGEVGAGYVETVAAIAARIVDGVGLPTIDVAAATSIRPGAAGLHIDSDSETAAQALDRLLLRASLLWLLEPAGAVRLLPVGFVADAPIVDAIEADRLATYKPVTRIVLGYQRNHRPHGDGEISAVFQASDGTYADGTPIEDLKPAVRSADVTSANTAAGFTGQGAFATQSLLNLDNGSFFTLPGRFQPYPGNANFFGAWKIAFLDGAGLDGLQPGEANSNRTEGRIAASFLGQGVLATLSSLSRTGGLLTGFGGLAGSDLARLGSTIADSFGAILSNAQVITGQGVAAGFTGQGALATLSDLGPDRVAFSTGGGNLVRNSGFEGPTYTFTTNAGVQTLPDGFGPYNNAGDAEQTSWRMLLGAARDGGVGITVSWTANTTTKGVVLRNGGTISNLDIMKAGRTYVVSAYVRASGAALGSTMDVTYNQPPAEKVEVANPPLTNKYQRYVFRLRWGDKVDRELYWLVRGANGVAAVDFDDFQIEEGDTPTAYTPGLLSGEIRFPYLAWNSVRLGQNVTRADGTTSATDNMLVTALGAASAIAGQGALATMGSIAFGSSYLTSLPRAISPSAFFPSGFMYASEIFQTSGQKNLNTYFPEDVNSNRTEARTASAITGQGALATVDRIQGDSQLGGSIANRLIPFPGDVNYLGARRIAWDEGSTVQSYKPEEGGSNKTETRTAGGIVGQGALATMGNIAYGSSYLTSLPRAISPSAFFPSGFMYASEIFQTSGQKNLNTYFPEDVNSNRTEARTASAITGQGALATADRIQGDGQLGGSIANRLIPFPGDVNYLGARRIAWDEGSTVQSYKPEEGGSNKTETRTAGGIVGQGALATLSALGPDKVAFKSGGGNLVRNSGLDGPTYTEATSAGTQTLPAGFAPYNNGGANEPTQWRVVNGGGRNGGPCLFISWEKNTTTKGAVLRNTGGVSNMDIMKVGRTYVVSAYARASGAALGQRMFVTFNQGPLQNTEVENPPLTNVYQRYAFRLRWGDKVDRELYWSILGANGVSGLDLVDFQIEEGDTPTAYAPGLLSGEVRFQYLSSTAVRLGSNIVRADGVTSATETLVVTSLGAASAIAGQGSLATQNAVSYRSQVADLPRAIAPSAFFASGYMYASEIYQSAGLKNLNTYFPEDVNSNRTEGRTAAAITGQGSLATENRIQSDGQLGGVIANRLTPYPGDHNFLGAGRVAWDEGSTVQSLKPQETGSNRTEGRTAAGITGQSYLATNYPDRLGPSPQHGSAYLAASAVAFAAGETTESLRPGEANSNRTEGRTAAAISGQGAFATAPQIGSWNVANYYNFSAFKLDYSITRSDGVNIVTEALSITQYGVAAAFAGQGTLATKNQAGAGDIAPSAVQQLAYTVLQQTITCAIGN